MIHKEIYLTPPHCQSSKKISFAQNKHINCSYTQYLTKNTRPVPKAYTFRTGRVPYLRVRSLDVEAQRAHHIAAVLSNTLRAPRRHPNPVHTPRINQVIQVALNLLLKNLL